MNNSENYTTAELRKMCQDLGGDQNEAQTTFGLANRLVSIYLTKIFLKTSLTPNWITVIGTVVYILGIACFVLGNWVGALVGFSLLVFAGILDACDGEVARFRKIKGGYGMSFVEPVSHDIMYSLTFFPIAYGAFVQTGNPFVFLFGAAASVFKLLYRIGEVRYLYGVIKHTVYTEDFPAPKKFKERSAVTKLMYVMYRHTATSTGLLMPLLIAGLFERLDIYVIFYGVYFFLLWCALFIKQVYRFRRLR